MSLNTVHDESRKIRSLRARAEQVRAAAEGMHDDVSRRAMLRIAEIYENEAIKLEASDR